MFSTYEATIHCLNYNGHESKKKTKHISCYRETCGLETRSSPSNSEGIGRPQSKGLTMQCRTVLELGHFEKKAIFSPKAENISIISLEKGRGSKIVVYS